MTRIEQKENRRREILIKSINLFAEQGYHETKITDIARNVNMSVGLLFHYFKSKEDLYYEIVSMGVNESKKLEELNNLKPLTYFEETINRLFAYSVNEPWVFQMFILMNQARKKCMPKKIRDMAISVNQIEYSARIIEKGQKDGVIRLGDPLLLSTCFWASVQGIMEEMANDKKMKIPNPEWILSILKKVEEK